MTAVLQIPEVQTIINSCRWAELAAVLDRLELQESLLQDALLQWPCALHILAHTYNNQLADARLLYKRLPADVKRVDVQVQAAFRLLQHLWHSDFQGVWPILAATAWEGPTKLLAQALQQQLQQQALQLLRNTYRDIALDKAVFITGLTQEALVAEAARLGWSFNEQQQALHISQTEAAAEEGDLTEHNYKQLKQLSELVIHFQTNAQAAA